MKRVFDLNADLGEGAGDDRAMLQIVTSASIACGGHAGNEETMRAAVRGALARGVRIGAHPGFPDRENFGRRRIEQPQHLTVSQIIAQMRALEHIVAEEGGSLAYLKLHGALANMAAEDLYLASAIFEAVAKCFPKVTVLALAASAQERAADALGMEVIAEAYADRAYTADGLLAPRTMAGAVLHDPAAAVRQCLHLAIRGEIKAIDGTIIRSSATSICVHGDTPGAVELARSVRRALSERNLMPPLRPSS